MLWLSESRLYSTIPTVGKHPHSQQPSGWGLHTYSGFSPLTLSPRPIQIIFQSIIRPCIISIYDTKLSVFIVFCCIYNPTLYNYFTSTVPRRICTSDCIVHWSTYTSDRTERVIRQRCQLITIHHPGLTYIFNFWHSGTLALSPECQSVRMSEIKNVR